MAADKKRGMQTVRDMVISLAVILLAAWVIYLFVPHDEHKNGVRTVDYRVELDSARRAAPYPVAAPEGLPDGWRATSVRYAPAGPQGSGGDEGNAWHLGFLTGGEEYVAVEQSDAPRSRRYVEKVSQGARETDRTQRAGGHEWTRWKGDKYDALVREDPETKATTVVTGTASFERLGELADALEAKRGPKPSGSPSAAE